LGLPIWIWLPGAGVVAALIGVIVSPVAVRVRGLYLGIVTLGLVFLGDHLFRNLEFICGAAGIGREWPELHLKLWKEGSPLLDLAHDGRWFGVDVSAPQKQILFLIPLVVLAAVAAKNLSRTRIGRALQAIRDRDIAAEVMGVAEFRHKTIAFALSSFYAGVAGALLGAIIGSLNPEYWSLALSVEFIAILLIGGVGTISGTLMGATFVVASTRLVEDFTRLLERTAAGGSFLHHIADVLVARGDDFGLISLQPTGPGLSVFQFNQLFYGLLIVLFLRFEPLGLYGIWGRARTFWKSWPFTY
jgi:branched-chain amino acid transport system permease protein